jgi:transposase
MSKHGSIKNNLENFFKKNQNLSTKQIFDKFSGLGAPKATLYRWIARLQATGTLARKSGSGRWPGRIKIATKANIRRIVQKFNHRSGCSQRKEAKKWNTTQQYVSFLLKKHTNIKCRKKIKRPLMSEKQKAESRPKCRKLSEKFADLEFVIDDESYLTKANTSLAGNDRFYSDNVNETPDNVKYKYKEKYEEKVLVYVAISPRGISKPVFFKSGLAINANVYRDECLKKSLVPFLRKHHRDNRFVFWPDLASAHYAKTVQVYLQGEKVTFVPKSLNPANVPKVRPIEDFWAVLKQKVYENGWSAKTIKQLIARIKWAFTKIEKVTFQRITEGVHKRLRKMAKYGIDAV